MILVDRRVKGSQIFGDAQNGRRAHRGQRNTQTKRSISQFHHKPRLYSRFVQQNHKERVERRKAVDSKRIAKD
jgi:hypothetical protein